MSKPLKIALFLSSVREGRNADRVAKFVMKHLETTHHKVDVLDPMIYELPLVKKPLHFYEDRSEAPKMIHDVNDIANSADAFLFVTAEYNNTIPPPLTNLVDHIALDSLNHKPSAIVTYSLGAFAGTKAGSHLRGLITGVGGFCIPSSVGVPRVNKEIDENGNTENQFLHSGMEKLQNELLWYAEAIKNQKESNGLPKV